METDCKTVVSGTHSVADNITNGQCINAENDNIGQCSNVAKDNITNDKCSNASNNNITNSQHSNADNNNDISINEVSTGDASNKTTESVASSCKKSGNMQFQNTASNISPSNVVDDNVTGKSDQKAVVEPQPPDTENDAVAKSPKNQINNKSINESDKSSAKEAGDDKDAESNPAGGGASPSYEVESILDKDEINGSKVYLVKWIGYPHSENMWVPVNDMCCPELIKKFEGSRKKRKSSNITTKKKKRKVVVEDYDSDETSNSFNATRDETPTPSSTKSVESPKKSSVQKNHSDKIKNIPDDMEVDKVLSIKQFGNEVYYVFKEVNTERAKFLHASTAKIRYPQHVINYLQSLVKFK